MQESKLRGRLYYYFIEKISHAVPIILTLYPMDIKLVDSVPVVPIIKFNSFIENVALYLPKIKVIYA